MGRRRAAVLITVHLVIIIHIAQWLWTGRTLSPLEPSEAMYTLTKGEVNAGFVLFALALVATALFGRFFCGWGCHVIALQDASLWLMKKLGLRPRAFRSRLLMWFPLGLAVYMFLWPTMLRYAVGPAVEAVWPAGMAYLGTAPSWSSLSKAFIVEDFWATFPGVWVSIPFVLAIGAGVVYFLGAKGFCTYACPYGGFFAPLDRLSPTRIVVDHDVCASCGVCTAVCTSNVRVHEEIKDFGMVVSPGCMKCLDCVSACPTGALSVKLTAPPMIRTNPREPAAATPGRRRRKPASPAHRPGWDLSWTEELSLTAFFLVAFVSLRGLYGVIPMLFAGALAAIGTWWVWKAWRTIRDANTRLHGFQLRRKGRVTLWGALFRGVAVLIVLAVAHAAYLSTQWYAGNVAVNQAARLASAVPENPAASRDALERAATHYARVYRGGLASTPKTDFQLALVLASLGHPAEGETALRRAIAREGEHDGLCVNLAEMMRRQGHDPTAYLEDVLARHPRYRDTRRALGAAYIESGRAPAAVALFEESARLSPRDDEALAKLAEAQMAAGLPAKAAATLARALKLRPGAPGYRRDRAIALFMGGDRAGAVEEMVRAAEEADPALRGGFFAIASDMAYQAGQPDQGAFLAQRAREQPNEVASQEDRK